MTDFATRLEALCGDAFEAEGLERRWGAVQPSKRPELADFQCNGAMGAAKAAKRPPRDVAAAVAARLEDAPLVSAVSVAGPGFINLSIAADALAARAETIASDPRAGAPLAEDTAKTVIDFGGPNVAKPMHVGHLRSAVIGDTLCRVLRFLGDEVVGDTHLGDWGLQMGHLLTELEREQPGLVYFADRDASPYPTEPPVTIEDLSRLYPAASAAAKAEPARMEASQRATAELQAGRPGYRALLRHFIDVSVAALKQDYAFLNVHFDLWKGEADVAHLLDDVIALFKKKDLAREDDGAWIVDVAREGENIEAEGKDGEVRLKNAMPPLMLVNSRGGTGYGTTDLATIYDRMHLMDPPPERLLYVVDQRQHLHFEQVFRAAGLAGLVEEGMCEHVGFGTVNGPDGKPFKTREGGVLRLADLNTEALEEADAKLEAANLPADMDADERGRVAEDVALAALRFADLQNSRTTNYVFDLSRFTNLEGKTGPYMLYAAVRVKSLLRRAEAEGNAPGAVRIESPSERALALVLDAFPAVLLGTRAKHMPHFLCEHLYALAQAFSSFYGAHAIAAEPDPAARSSRLALAAATLRQLEVGLDLLGCRIPERM